MPSLTALSTDGLALVVMGVTGAGKSTLGRALAADLCGRFLEGDDFHPPANIAKMRAGLPLNSDDREPFLRAFAWALRRAGEEGLAVGACSALKRSYRDLLRRECPRVRFVHLSMPQPVLAERLAGRHHHFMPPSLLTSQLADLEPPSPDEHAIIVEGNLAIECQVAAIRRGLGLDAK